MTHGQLRLEGMVAKRSLRQLDSGSGEGDFFGRKVEQVSTYSGTEEPTGSFATATNSGAGNVVVRLNALQACHTMPVSLGYDPRVVSEALALVGFVPSNLLINGVPYGPGGTSASFTGTVYVSEQYATAATLAAAYAGNLNVLSTGSCVSGVLQDVLDVAEHQAKATIGLPGLVDPSEWLDDALSEVSSLDVLEQTRTDVEGILRLCARMPLNEPLFDVDETGNVEVFFRLAGSGILLVIKASRSLEVFGNEEGEKWRAQYDLGGRIWKRELPNDMEAIFSR